MYIEKILVATDGSDLAVHAAGVAVVLARAGGHRMLAFSVAQPHLSFAPEALAASDLQAQVRRALDEADAHVKTVARIAGRDHVACDTLTIVSTTPGLEIVRTAEEQGCDLIVMGAHGPADANPLHAGSVAQHVLGWSSIPVPVLRDPREASQPEFSDGPTP